RSRHAEPAGRDCRRRAAAASGRNRPAGRGGTRRPSSATRRARHRRRAGPPADTAPAAVWAGSWASSSGGGAAPLDAADETHLAGSRGEEGSPVVLVPGKLAGSWHARAHGPTSSRRPWAIVRRVRRRPPGLLFGSAGRICARLAIRTFGSARA